MSEVIASRSAEVADGLERAAAIIEERGWTRGYYDRRGRVCLVRALDLAAGFWAPELELPYAVLQARYGAMYEAVEDEVHDLPVLWNDDSARSRQQVCQMLRSAAARVRSASEAAGRAVVAASGD